MNESDFDSYVTGIYFRRGKMENYIVINGKKAELTEEQLKALGIEPHKVDKPFERADHYADFYYVMPTGLVGSGVEYDNNFDNRCFSVANYCKDRDLLEQRALHETLNRLLWRYSMQHNGDKIDWDARGPKFKIVYDHCCRTFDIDDNWSSESEGAVYFYKIDIAEAAINEIIIPFMEEHPEFKW